MGKGDPLSLLYDLVVSKRRYAFKSIRISSSWKYGKGRFLAATAFYSKFWLVGTNDPSGNALPCFSNFS